MMMSSRKKEGPIRGCVIPILAVIGLIAMCFLICFVVFTLNRASLPSQTSMFLPFLG